MKKGRGSYHENPQMLLDPAHYGLSPTEIEELYPEPERLPPKNLENEINFIPDSCENWIEITNQEVPEYLQLNEKQWDRISVTSNMIREKFDEHFDDIDVEEEIHDRRAFFENLSRKDQALIKQAAVVSAMTNNPELLFLLKCMGRETDTGFIRHLEKENNLNLDAMRVATQLFNLTYRMWELNHAAQVDSQNPEHLRAIERKLQTVKKSASFLSHFQLEATHATDKNTLEKITKEEVLIKSDTSYKKHYEGDGVYTGILGSYRWWGSGEFCTFRTPLADTLPIIVNYHYPKSMANVLCEGLSIAGREEVAATAHGLVQYRQREFDDDTISDCKLHWLKKMLGKTPTVINDEDNLPCVVMSTDEEPIVWASLCRSLRIRRFIPLSELPQSQIPTTEILNE